ncbi:3-keto-disaccharide hydrolase [Olivibacter sitiensis]|uniref:3-keto-disaccharide hydrolase n=1 Tax=Olivibacter sitiensis TaxID=376470 RepID=UPI0004048497|nr:DUF1080 domain-containing protein [Olivibacter sitiensis]
MQAFAQAPNTLSNSEKKDGWKLLFDGKSTKGWHTYLKDGVGNAWRVEDGALTFDPTASERGDIVTDDIYGDFELSIDWKISLGGNSGIIFNVQEKPEFNATYLTGIEMQVLDNIEAGDRHIPNHLAGSLYDLIGNAEVSKPKAVGEWNTARIHQKDGEITLWLNDVKTASVKRGSSTWDELIANSKFKDWKDFAKYDSGKIALQDHGNKVAFRNIKIRKL